MPISHIQLQLLNSKVDVAVHIRSFSLQILLFPFDCCVKNRKRKGEAIASGPHTAAWARSQGWTGLTGEDLAASYREGDEIARAAIERTGRAIGQAIASATALVDLDIVAIGGGFSHATPDLFDHIRTAVATRSVFGFVTKVKVVPTGLSSDGPLVGAGALIHRAERVA